MQATILRMIFFPGGQKIKGHSRISVRCYKLIEVSGGGGGSSNMTLGIPRADNRRRKATGNELR